MSTAVEIPEPIPDRSDVSKYVRFAVLNRVAHVGIVLDKITRQVRRAERYEKFAATGNVKDLEAPESEDEEMGVNIGNENHYHYQVATPAAEVPPAPEPVPVTTTETDKPPAAPPPAAVPTTQKKSRWWPTVIGAALLASGAGAGIGYIVHDQITSDNTPDTTDWKLGVEVTDQP